MSGGGGMELGRSKSANWATSQGTSASESSDISRSVSDAVSGGQSTSTQDIAFRDLFARMYGGATGAAATAAANAPELMGAARQLFTGGTQFLQGLGGDAGTQYMESRLTGDNPVLGSAIDQLREQSGRLFTENINPAITSRSVAGGNLGGGRQGVAQGIGAGEAARAFTQGATTLQLADIQQRDQIAGQVAQNSIQSAATGLGALPGLLDLVERGNNAELGTYATLSGILGGPTVLGQSQSTQFSKSTAQSMSDAFAKSYAQQSSSAHGRSNAWQFKGWAGSGG